MHFRRGRSSATEFEFHVGNNVLETVYQYKYLSVISNDKGDFSMSADILSESAGHAFGI